MDKSFWNKLKHLFFEPKQLESKQEDINLESDSAPVRKLSFLHWVVIGVCLGLAAMILHNFYSINDEINQETSREVVMDEEVEESFLSTSSKQPATMQEYEQLYEAQLKEILGKINGVGEVSVMVNLDSTAQVVYEKNRTRQQSTTTENDREGGTRNLEDSREEEQVVMAKDGTGEDPVIQMTRKPPIRGVLIVASGAHNMQVKAWITEAVQRVLDVPPHKISVLPKK